MHFKCLMMAGLLASLVVLSGCNQISCAIGGTSCQKDLPITEVKQLRNVIVKDEVVELAPTGDVTPLSDCTTYVRTFEYKDLVTDTFSTRVTQYITQCPGRESETTSRSLGSAGTQFDTRIWK